MLWSYGVPTINIQANVSVDVLVQAAEQLSETELRQFTAQILALSAKRTAPSVTQEEAELLLHINSRLPEDVRRRYDELIAKRDAETLSKVPPGWRGEETCRRLPVIRTGCESLLA